MGDTATAVEPLGLVEHGPRTRSQWDVFDDQHISVDDSLHGSQLVDYEDTSAAYIWKHTDKTGLRLDWGDGQGGGGGVDRDRLPGFPILQRSGPGNTCVYVGTALKEKRIQEVNLVEVVPAVLSKRRWPERLTQKKPRPAYRRVRGTFFCSQGLLASS